jgi:hypothetical protein
MANVDFLITKLDRKLKSIYQEIALVAKTGKTVTVIDPLLSEYLQLTSTEGIIPAIQYIALDGLARHFELYEDDRERSQLLAVMADELNQSTDSEILASAQVIQYTYPSIYKISREQMTLTQKRTVSKITGLNITSPNQENLLTDKIPTPPNQLNPPQPLTISLPKYRTQVMIAVGISSFLAAILGVLLANNLNKTPALNIDRGTNSPISTIGSEPTDTSNNNHNLDRKPVTNTSPVPAVEISPTTPNPNNSPAPVLETSPTTPNLNDSTTENSTIDSPQVSPSRSSPAQAIRDHYQALNDRNYDLTWDNLSSRFKAESGKSSTLARQEYDDWWNSIRSIDLQRSETLSISSDGNRAIVSYRHGYTMNTGRFVQDRHTRIFLVWDGGKGKWLIDRRV